MKKITKQELNEKKLIEVCDNCKKASCWYGEFMCDMADIARTIKLPIEKLRKLNLESEDFWSDKKLKEVYGTENL